MSAFAITMSASGKRTVAGSVAALGVAYGIHHKDPWIHPWKKSAGIDMSNLLAATKAPTNPRLTTTTFSDDELKEHYHAFTKKGIGAGRRLGQNHTVFYLMWTAVFPLWLCVGGAWGVQSAYQEAVKSKLLGPARNGAVLAGGVSRALLMSSAAFASMPFYLKWSGAHASHTRAYAHVHTCMHARTHADTHTHICTHTHTTHAPLRSEAQDRALAGEADKPGAADDWKDANQQFRDFLEKRARKKARKAERSAAG